MKRLFITIIGLLTLASCTQDGADLLDPATTGITEEDVFTDARNTMLFLNDIYGDIFPVIPQSGNKMRLGDEVMLEAVTDNGSSNWSTAPWQNFNSGAWTPLSSTFSTTEWNNNWVTIRACNLFLSHIDEVPLNPEYQFDAAIRNIRKGECLFLKAFFYSELFKHFGGLPIMDRVVSITDDMQIPRSTVDETVAYIVDLCDQSAALLPVTHPDIDFGRATRGAALSLKARMLLYAASPLWNNPGKPDDSPFRGAYDPAKWNKAAQAAAAVIGMNQYQLHTDISNLFITRVNPELIFVRMNQPCSYMTSMCIPSTLCPAGRFANSGIHQVTYNLLKEYEILRDGAAYFIDDDPALTGYDPQNPYVNRDPRFYRDCMFNGFPYQGKTTRFGVSESGVSTPEHNPPYTSPYYTYVYSVKFADLSIIINFDARNPANGAKTDQNYPYLRYAEVLLNYAEAMNEAFGPETDGLGNGMTALWAVNEVRTRAQYPVSNNSGYPLEQYFGYTGGMPPIPHGLSADELREKIRHERRIELSFEEHRFWDVRRWMIPPDAMTRIQAQIPVWKTETRVEYEIRTIQNRVFERKMYRMPIPEQQIYNNPSLVQNPGWTFSPEGAD
jgi:hypothetical protein